MKLNSAPKGYTIIELVFGTAMFSFVGLALYSLLSISMVLAAKNAAMNTAHEQARTAMVQMLQDLHSAVSLPSLADVNGTQTTGAGPAPGISFQKWSSGPHRITSDAGTNQNQVTLGLTAGAGPTPVVGERLIIPTHQIEDDITAVTANGSSFTVTLAHNLPVAISGTNTYTIACFVTDRCAYAVARGNLQWRGPTTKKTFSVLGSDITSSAPFSTPVTPAGALYYRFVSAINLSTADVKYSNRGFKAANIFLNGQVPMKARLTTYL